MVSNWPVRERRVCRKLLPELEEEHHPLDKKTKKQLENKRYRGKKKGDPQADFLKKEAERQRLHRASRTEEQRAVQREKDRRRKAAQRARDKENGTRPAPQRPVTRLDEKKLEEERAHNRLSQQNRRSNMTAQKKRREREKNRERYYRRKEKSHPSNFNEMANACNGPMSVTAKTSAVCRLKRKLKRGKGFLISLKGLIKSMQKKDPKAVNEHGIIYSSPRKRKGQNVDGLSKVISALEKKRSKDALKTKSLVVTCANKVLNRYESAGFLKKYKLCKLRKDSPYKRKESARSKTVRDFFEAKAVHLPGKKNVC